MIKAFDKGNLNELRIESVQRSITECQPVRPSANHEGSRHLNDKRDDGPLDTVKHN
jgi:hypothetical protein